MRVYRDDERSKKAGPLLWIGRLFLALLFLLGIGSAVFLLFFRGYVVDTQNGREFHLPFLAGESAISVFSSEAVTLEKDSRAEPNPLRAVLLPLEAVEDGSAASLLREAGGNAVILDMKDDAGALSFVSDLPEAVKARVSCADPARNEALSDFNRRSAYTIARVSAFRDDALAEARPDWSLLRTSGSAWRDGERYAWLSPASEDAGDYLLALCRELSALGFDEVLLTNCAYPTEGRQELLTDEAAGDAAARSAALESVYTRLGDLSLETGLRISIHWTPSAADAEGLPASGQSLESAALAFDRVFLEGTPAEIRAAFSASGVSMEDSSFISVISDKIEGDSAWAMF